MEEPIPTVINNGKEIYELIDTALKIGLGALIAGSFTYITTKANHKHELLKEKFNKKITMLNEATGIIEIYFKSSFELMDNWYGNGIGKSKMFKDLNADEKEKYVKIDNIYVINTRDVQYAFAQFNILGLRNINNLIKEYDKNLIQLRNTIITNQINFLSEDEVLKLIDGTSEIRNNYYTEVKKYFDDLK